MFKYVKNYLNKKAELKKYRQLTYAITAFISAQNIEILHAIPADKFGESFSADTAKLINALITKSVLAVHVEQTLTLSGLCGVFLSAMVDSAAVYIAVCEQLVVCLDVGDCMPSEYDIDNLYKCFEDRKNAYEKALAFIESL